MVSRQDKILRYHRELLSDRLRTESHRRAIFETVKPGDVVADVGTGTGLLAFYACQAGARRVFAIESDDVIDLARLLCRSNGFADRITFFNDLSFCVDVPEQADVLVTDIGGSSALRSGLLRAVVDGRKRFLKSEGTIIPRTLELFLVPLHEPDLHRDRIAFWTEGVQGLDFSPVRPYAANNLERVDLTRERFLCEPACLLRIELARAAEAAVRARTVCRIRQSGVVHGLGSWWQAQLSANVWLANGPDAPRADWPAVFFPLDPAVTVVEGDRLSIDVATFNGAEWRWRIIVEGAGGRRIEQDHATLSGFPLSVDEWRVRSDDYTPQASRRSEAERFIMACFDGRRTVREVAVDAFRHYPDIFQSLQGALASVRAAAVRTATTAAGHGGYGPSPPTQSS